MRHYIDKELDGHVMVFDGVCDIIDTAVKHNEGKPSPLVSTKLLGQMLKGTGISGWAGLQKAVREPSRGALDTVEAMLEKVRQHLPTPKSRRRKMRWDEETGEVDPDRLLAGEPDFYRNVRREVTAGPYNVALLCNLDAIYGTKASDIFWRGAGAIAACDLLEEAGYSVELWMWCLGRWVYPDHHNQFHTVKLKECGEPVDTHTLICGLSAWLLRGGVFPSFAAAGGTDIGGVNYNLGDWIKHMDISENCQQVHMKFCQSEQEAIANAKELLEEVSSVHAY